MKKMTLKQLLKDSITSDYWEEDAEDFLSKKGIKLPSMFRETIYKVAWKTGWRPKPQK